MMNQKKEPLQKRVLHKIVKWKQPILADETNYHERPARLYKELFRAFKTFLELARGFISFRDVSHCVTVFGSARFREDHQYYKLSRLVGQELAKNNYIVMTGGGPGVMEAAS